MTLSELIAFLGIGIYLFIREKAFWEHIYKK